MRIDLKKVTPLVKAALREDIGRGDVTTWLCIPKEQEAKAAIIFEEDGIVCGMDVASLTFHLVDGAIKFKPLARDGDRVRAGKVVARIEGSARSILIGERVALNFLGHSSGIATRTAEYVKRAKPYGAKIMDTRKTTPGLRYLQKYAVRVGGGHNHRMGLYDQILIKDNHIKVQSSKFKVRSSRKKASIIRELASHARRRAPKGMKVEVECENLDDFKEALKARTDVIMLDNMKIAQMRRAVKMVAKPTKLEASGRITLKNVREIARTGVDMISIGELTHSVRSIDVALEML